MKYTASRRIQLARGSGRHVKPPCAKTLPRKSSRVTFALDHGEDRSRQRQRLEKFHRVRLKLCPCIQGDRHSRIMRDIGCGCWNRGRTLGRIAALLLPFILVSSEFTTSAAATPVGTAVKLFPSVSAAPCRSESQDSAAFWARVHLVGLPLALV